MLTPLEPNLIKVVILAAGVGSRIRPLTDTCPKSLLSVGGKPIIERMIRNVQSCGLSEFIFVLGYMEDKIRDFIKINFPSLDVTFVVNERYQETNTGYSLMLTEDAVDASSFIKFDADVVFNPSILCRLLTDSSENALCIDQNINLDVEEVKVVTDGLGQILKVSKSIDPNSATGESMGIEKISAKTSSLLFSELREMMKNTDNHQDYYEAAYERLIAKDVHFSAVNITDLDWVEIDTHEDFSNANLIFLNH
jgi:choline kinase